MTAHTSVIGTDFPVRDARDRVTGSIRFVLDHAVPDMAHARLVTSQLPHARIRSIDTDAATAMPGVVTVVTGADLVDRDGLDPYFGDQRADQPAIAIDKVRHVGEPVAVVVADSAATAREAALRVVVDYDPLDHVVDAEEALELGAPTLHDAHPGNDCGAWGLHRGDVDAALADADHVYRGTWTTPPGSHVPMEPHVCIARWEDEAHDGRTGNGDDRGHGGRSLHVWSAAQSPHAVRTALSGMFGLPEDDVRVEVGNLGGAYGAKGQVKIEPLVACAALVAGRPVRLELDRDEVFFTIGRHAAVVRLTTGMDAQGHIVARDVDVVYNAGAYAVTSPGATRQALVRAPGPYRLANVRLRSRAAYTNTVPTGPFRGAMTAQVCFAYESQLDDIAADLGIDPVELRRRNLLREGDVFATGEELEDVHFTSLLDDAATAIGWDEPLPATAPGRVRGRGLGIMLKSTITPSRTEVRLAVDTAGRIRLDSSSVEMGQGVTATLVQLVADWLEVDPDLVDVPAPDTARTPFDTTTSSSRTTFSAGAAVRDAIAALRDELAALAAGQWGCDRDDVEVDGGTVMRRADPASAVTWAELVAASGRDEVLVDGVFQSRDELDSTDPMDVHGRATVHWHQGAAAVEVEVDVETGRVTVERAHGNCWAGRVVSPLRVRQQNQGCIVFGLGPALFEQVVYEGGQFTNPNLSEYLLPSILDVPRDLTSSALEGGPDSELHGVGEMALPGLAPAIANALFHATGARVRDLPLTPERVLRALREAGATPDRATGTIPERASDPAGTGAGDPTTMGGASAHA